MSAADSSRVPSPDGGEPSPLDASEVEALRRCVATALRGDSLGATQDERVAVADRAANAIGRLRESAFARVPAPGDGAPTPKWLYDLLRLAAYRGWNEYGGTFDFGTVEECKAFEELVWPEVEARLGAAAVPPAAARPQRHPVDIPGGKSICDLPVPPHLLAEAREAVLAMGAPAAAQPPAGQHPEAWAHIAACPECRAMGYPEPPESLAIGVMTVNDGAAVVRAGEMLRALRVYGYAPRAAAAQPGERAEAMRRIREIAFDWLHSEGDDQTWEVVRAIYGLADNAWRATGQAPAGTPGERERDVFQAMTEVGDLPDPESSEFMSQVAESWSRLHNAAIYAHAGEYDKALSVLRAASASTESRGAAPQDGSNR